MQFRVQGSLFTIHMSRGIVCALLVIACANLLVAFPARAESKTIEVEYAYAPGYNESKANARRIATRKARRKALEQAGMFVAGLPEVREYRLTRDEVTAYTSSIVLSDVIPSQDQDTARHSEVAVRVRCTIDTDVVVQQIDRYRENEELGEQVEDMARSQATLRQERESLVKQLAAEKDKANAERMQEKLSAVLDQEESIDAANRVWAAVSPKLDFYSGGEVNRQVRLDDLDDTTGKLEQLARSSPENQQVSLLLATLYEQKDDLPHAEALLREAISRHPDSPLLHIRLGVVLRQEKKYDEALQEFRVIEKRRPNQPQMLFQTGLTHKANGNCRFGSSYMKRFLMYTRNVDSPDIDHLKPKAQHIIDACGEQPKPRKARQH